MALLESVILNTTINEKESRYVVVVDILNASIQANIGDKFINTCIRSIPETLIIKVTPEVYGKYMAYYVKFNMLLYVCLIKYLYVIMKVTVLFYMKLVKDPEYIDFDINPYKPCVFNKISGGDQLNLVWYFYDMKISHQIPKIVTIIVE